VHWFKANKIRSDNRKYFALKKRIKIEGLQEDQDFYTDEKGRVVFTALYHIKRGYCCKSGCKHCPYGFRKD